MRHEASVRIINLMRTAESPSRTVTSRLAAPQVGRALVVFFDDAHRVARVNRYRDKIEQCLISRLGMLKRESFVRFGQIRNFRAVRWFTSFVRGLVMANAIRSIAMATFRLTRIASRNFRFVHNLEQHAPSFPILLVKTVSRKVKNWAQRASCDQFRRFPAVNRGDSPAARGRGGISIRLAAIIYRFEEPLVSNSSLSESASGLTMPSASSFNFSSAAPSSSRVCCRSLAAFFSPKSPAKVRTVP
ncbi:MAG: hypothetical protein QOE81_768 [Verrucomicrobiota bacterium]